MLEKLKDLPKGIDGVKAVGRVSKEDYERVLEPMLDAARTDGRKVRFLYQFGPDFEGLAPSAAWEDAKVGLRSMRLFEGCAIVTDVSWLREMTSFAGFLMPCPVKVFTNAERDGAVAWLSSLPEKAAISHRLIPESGVLVVEIRQPLRAQDFDALAVTADSWIEAHGELRGLVVHTREFPGWENVGGAIRHMCFIRDHQRKIERVALASDSQLASLAPRLAEHFVSAEVQNFAYDALEAATAWAAGGRGRKVAPEGAKPSPDAHRA